MTSDFNVHIQGGGIAALACQHLLKTAGVHASLETIARPRVPALLLSSQAMHLLGDIFARNDRFGGCHRITTRRVAWGSETIAIPHAGVVASEEWLLTTIGAADDPVCRAPSYVVHTTKPLPAVTVHHRFGSQKAAGSRVTLKQSADARACYVESLASGWLFVIPTNDSEGWVLAVGAPSEVLLAQSTLASTVIDHIDAAAGVFDTSPSIAAPLCGPGWMACGSAAMTFDPLCGDGTASAAREAILAAAVMAAIAKGGDTHALLLHYESLLIGAMRRHLALCGEFYASGGTGPWWDAQCDLLRQGHAWCTTRLALTPEPRYRLQDFDLVRIEPAS